MTTPTNTGGRNVYGPSAQAGSTPAQGRAPPKLLRDKDVMLSNAGRFPSGLTLPRSDQSTQGSRSQRFPLVGTCSPSPPTCRISRTTASITSCPPPTDDFACSHLPCPPPLAIARERVYPAPVHRTTPTRRAEDVAREVVPGVGAGDNRGTAGLPGLPADVVRELVARLVGCRGCERSDDSWPLAGARLPPPRGRGRGRSAAPPLARCRR